jgi:hypothetical protein
VIGTSKTLEEAMESLVWERKAKLDCSPKFGKVAKIEKRPENEQQKSWNKAPATA